MYAPAAPVTLLPSSVVQLIVTLPQTDLTTLTTNLWWNKTNAVASNEVVVLGLFLPGTHTFSAAGIYHVGIAVTDDIKELIVSRADAGTIRARALEGGMTPLRDNGWDKVRNGVTTVEEVLRVTRGS